MYTLLLGIRRLFIAFFQDASGSSHVRSREGPFSSFFPQCGCYFSRLLLFQVSKNVFKFGKQLSVFCRGSNVGGMLGLSLPKELLEDKVQMCSSPKMQERHLESSKECANCGARVFPLFFQGIATDRKPSAVQSQFFYSYKYLSIDIYIYLQSIYIYMFIFRDFKFRYIFIF